MKSELIFVKIKTKSWLSKVIFSLSVAIVLNKKMENYNFGKNMHLAKVWIYFPTMRLYAFSKFLRITKMETK